MSTALFSSNAVAQKLLNITGVTFQKASQSRVSQVVINNSTRKTLSKSDDLGVFRIQAAVGDTLFFTKNQYTTQALVVLNDNLLSVYLQPIVTLDEVNITDKSTRQELASALSEYRKKTPFSSLHPGVAASIFSPISGISNLFGKTANRARRFEAYSKRELEQVEIEKRYNKAVIKKIVDIPDEDMTAFMMAFTPSYDQIRVWADYDIIKYVQTSYAYFQKNKESLKPQKLY
ncbi:hypothetical protein ACFQZS_12015 [Mucilaginibacter calamicampi]|uniref:CarboxypepD_reg-like domain-containing protein n=1 Tax=Mucilaginibacter calamicampi TaxID=1302352 RepID=A0ABW2Z250_9SPHI